MATKEIVSGVGAEDSAESSSSNIQPEAILLLSEETMSANADLVVNKMQSTVNRLLMTRPAEHSAGESNNLEVS